MVSVVLPGNSKLHHLATNIGISGFKYIIGPEATLRRRFVWMLLLICAVGWMIWNIQGRISYFLQYPTSVTSEIKYEKQLTFPKVTICNQNKIRASAAYTASEDSPEGEKTLFEALDRYYQALAAVGDKKLDQDFIRSYGDVISKIDQNFLLSRLSHTKMNMIQKCLWKGIPCSPENFKPVLTDSGLCYQFTGWNNEKLIVDNAGAKGGLEVTLQMEHYDYMRGMGDAAGAVVVITDDNETDVFAAEVGVAISVGARTSIALRKTEIQDLSQPHGTCGEKILTNFPVSVPYSPIRCQLDCLTSFLIDRCGCVEDFMPDGIETPICSFLQRLQCVKPSKQSFYADGLISSCNCPSPCKSVRYDKTVSQTLLSDQALQALSMSAINKDLKEINYAVTVQAWALLNRYDSDITINISTIIQILVQVHQAPDEALAAFVIYEKDYSLLLSLVIDAKLQNEVNDMAVQAFNSAQPDYDTYDRVKHNYGQNIFMEHGGNATKIPLLHIQLIKDRVISIIPDIATSSRMKVDALIASDCMLTNCEKLVITYSLIVLQYQYTQNALNAMYIYMDAMETVLNTLGHLNEEQIETIQRDRKKVTNEIKRISDVMNLFNAQLNQLKTVTDWNYWKTIRTQSVRVLLPDFFKSNVLTLEIYFEDLAVSKNVKAEAYSLEGLICDMGGSIGLCLGGSILTFVEIFDLLFIFWFKKSKPETSIVEKTQNRVNGDVKKIAEA